ncbi:general transcription factor 3C polypeptide 6 [Pseudomyrmex gracilis]|uniref:general transcription factor 3C polypeptide 6 n=1 Tax=Pseudomyrmex gracilis TaxID=219809 RepID=UPI0009958A93|nr:general transcription factor 3C polypeptide 6 [Pseudomyrmex gracilis]
MQSDEMLSENEEEMLVYVQFEGLVGSNVFDDKNLELDIVGIDTEHPIIQINGRFYEGTYEDAVGTYMFFEKEDNPQVDDPIFDKAPTLKYFAKTRKLLKMQRVFTKPRTEILGDSEQSGCTPNMEILSQAGVPPKYQEEALQFWEQLYKERQEELNMHLEKQQIGEEKHPEDTVSELKEDSHTANKNDPLIIDKVEDNSLSLLINKTKDNSEKT